MGNIKLKGQLDLKAETQHKSSNKIWKLAYLGDGGKEITI